MTYFKFKLPAGNGYSPDWCGECYVPKNPKVLFYNEPEGFGVASCDTPEAELDKNLTPITEKEAMLLKYEAKAKQFSAGVYIGETMKDKWLPAQARITELPVEGEPEPDKGERHVTDSKAVFCSICHRLLGHQLAYSDGTYALKIGKTTLNGIPAGQTVNVPCNGHTAKVITGGFKTVVIHDKSADNPETLFCPECHELLVLKARETAESEVEEYIPEAVNIEYRTTQYDIFTCPNGHRVRLEVDGG